MSKQLCNSYSTGGVGYRFEAYVQACFVALMLTGGFAPGLPCWPIIEIKLQGHVDGFDTDDAIVFVEHPQSKEKRKLLIQIKHSISITESDSQFNKAIQAAWDDFNNAQLFDRNKDKIAIITFALSKTDIEDALFVLQFAKHAINYIEFDSRIRKANFSSKSKIAKYETLRKCINKANRNNHVSDEQFLQFLKCFMIYSYDLKNEDSALLSILRSHISRYISNPSVSGVFSSLVDFVGNKNIYAGTILLENIPEDIVEAFTEFPTNRIIIPEEYQNIPSRDWNYHSDASMLSCLTLLGSWSENNENDINVVSHLLCEGIDIWHKKAREISNESDSILTYKRGIWSIVDRIEAWKQLKHRLTDKELDAFENNAIEVLGETESLLEYAKEERFLYSFKNRNFNHSESLRQGVAEGLVIISIYFNECRTRRNGQQIADNVVQNLLFQADWMRWASLRDLLPTLAEASPNVFLNSVEHALDLKQCPFKILIEQEGCRITDNHYQYGVIRGLECLAWDEQYLVRACVALARLAILQNVHSEKSSAFSSLVNILLPWRPQTHASSKKRLAVIKALFNKVPDTACNLVTELLPSRYQTSFGTYKPIWRISDNADDLNTSEIPNDFWYNVSAYVSVTLDCIQSNPNHLALFVDYLNKFSEATFDEFTRILTSKPFMELDEGKRTIVWEKLTVFLNRQREYPEQGFSLSENKIKCLENLVKLLQPNSPYLYLRRLFSYQPHELYEKFNDYTEQDKILSNKRFDAVNIILNQDGLDGIIKFANEVNNPDEVGYALGHVAGIEKDILPSWLDSNNPIIKKLSHCYIYEHCKNDDYTWSYSLDKSAWTQEQIAQFLLIHPFNTNTWSMVNDLLKDNIDMYWENVSINPYTYGVDLSIAVSNLISHDRFDAALYCLNVMHANQKDIDTNLCLDVLCRIIDSNSSVSNYSYVAELIRYLQECQTDRHNDLMRIEFAFLQISYKSELFDPKTLELELSTNPEFFCEIIQRTYRSSHDENSSIDVSSEKQVIAEQCWWLLHEWHRPPGIKEDGSFDEIQFKEWLNEVEHICENTGHIDVAQQVIGEVLAHVPLNDDGVNLPDYIIGLLEEINNMRIGYKAGLINSRKFYGVDLYEKSDLSLENKYTKIADAIENRGYPSLAELFKQLATLYRN